MNPDPQQEDLDQLARLARTAQPPALDAVTARRMVRTAIAANDRPDRPRFSLPRLAWFGLVLSVLGLGAVFLSDLRSSGSSLEVGRAERPLRVALPSGDSVTAAPGARLEWSAEQPTRRQVRLVQGSALFDVVRSGSGDPFEVHTKHVRVRVLGTVFSVEVESRLTRVRVYEGRVQVGQRILQAPAVWTSQPEAMPTPDPLAAEAEHAVRVRAEPDPGQASAVVSPLSEPPSAAPMQAKSAPAKPKLTPKPEDPTPSQARAWLTAGAFQRALEAALRLHKAALDPEWIKIRADAERALGRFAEAVDSYERLADMLPKEARDGAGYDAASLAMHGLHDPARALALIERLQLDDDRSAFRERASVLRVDALVALKRTEEARTAAERYLQREPETAVSERMRELVE